MQYQPDCTKDVLKNSQNPLMDNQQLQIKSRKKDIKNRENTTAQLDCAEDVFKSATNCPLENEQHQIKSRKKDLKNNKKITAGQLKAIKNKVALKTKVVKKSKEKEKSNEQATVLNPGSTVTHNFNALTALKEIKKSAKNDTKNKEIIKPKSVETNESSKSRGLKEIKESAKKDTKTKQIIKPKPVKTDESAKATLIWKPLEVIKGEKPLRTVKKPIQQTLITKKDKERLKKEMKLKIDKLPIETFRAKMHDEKIVENVRNALSALVDKALDTLQKVPRERLEADSKNLQKKEVKLKPRPNPLLIDPTAQFQANVKENVMRKSWKIGGSIENRSKHI